MQRTHLEMPGLGVFTHLMIVSVVLLWTVFTTPAHGDLLPKCTIDFDGPCPSVDPVCGTLFDGGLGCQFENLPFCYSTGFFAYKVTPAAPLTIAFEGDVISIDLFFAHTTGASGTMRFFNAAGEEVDDPLETNGNCLQFMPDHQEVILSEMIETVEVTAKGGDVWIDTMTINSIIPDIPGDLNGDGFVDGADLLILLSEWGDCESPDDCHADLNNDGTVDGADLLILLSNWG